MGVKPLWVLALALGACVPKLDQDSGVTDGDQDGYASWEGDCDDTNAWVSPASAEYCDGLDNDCDGEVDEGPAVDGEVYGPDADGDGFGSRAPADQVQTCEAPEGFVSDVTDCDDADASIHPEVEESCDGVDNNCNGQADEGLGDGLTWYPDADSDGYGDGTAGVQDCDIPSGYVDDGTDCDDTDASIYPGSVEVGGNSVDEDCDGADSPSQEPANLLVRDISLAGPYTVAPGAVTDISFWVENTGETEVDAYSVSIWISEDHILDVQDAEVNAGSTTNTLAPGESIAWTSPVPVPGSAATGIAYVGVMVDSEAEVDELTETDNTDTHLLKISNDPCVLGQCCFDDIQTSASVPNHLDGELHATADSLNSEGAFWDDVEVELEAGDAMELFVSSDALDAHLQVYDESCALLAENEDSAVSTHSRTDAHLSWTAPATGIYTLAIKAPEGSVGDYDLVINRGDGENCLADDWQVGAWPYSYNYSLNSQDAANAFTHGNAAHYYYDDVEFKGERDSSLAYTFTLDAWGSSPLDDPYLYLLDPECQVYEQDDDSSSGSDYGSEIEVAAGFPYDGIWTLVATSYYGSDSSQGEGGVELAVARQ